MLLALQRLFVFRLLSSSSSSSLLPLSSSTLDRHSSHHSHSFATRLAADSSPRQTCAPRFTEILRKQNTSGAVDNMKHFTGRVVALATLAASVHALNGIVAPANISADTKFEVTFENANSDQYRVYLAAALAGVNGPTCKCCCDFTGFPFPVRLLTRIAQATSSTRHLSRAHSATSPSPRA